MVKKLKSMKDCFVVDEHKHNLVPRSWLKRLLNLYFNQRYSMPVLLRLTEYFYSLYKKKKNKFYLLLAKYFKRKNEILNNFEHGFEHNIAFGTLFHHTGVTLNDHIVIEEGVQIFKNVTFALVKGRTCHIGKNTIIFSHVIILGKKIGKNCVIGAGSVVTKDIPDNSIVAGVPARVIGKCKNSYDYLEFK